jgi:protein-disulfide isomerase
MDQNVEPKQNNSIPLAIVLAGLLIAGAVYLRGESTTPGTKTTPSPAPVVATDLSIPPIDSTDHLLGNPAAPITLVEYSDFDCPFCRNFHPTVERIVAEYGKTGSIAWAYRHFPLTELHPNAKKKAEASECAAELAGNDIFWKFADVIFKGPAAHAADPLPELTTEAKQVGVNQKDFESCYASGRHTAKVEKQYADAAAAGGRGTPFTILILKEKLTDEQKTKISGAFGKYGPDSYGISKDGLRVSLNGSLPYESVKQAIAALVK